MQIRKENIRKKRGSKASCGGFLPSYLLFECCEEQPEEVDDMRPDSPLPRRIEEASDEAGLKREQLQGAEAAGDEATQSRILGASVMRGLKQI